MWYLKRKQNKEKRMACEYIYVRTELPNTHINIYTAVDGNE